MSETGYGVALLNDAKYAYSAHRNVLGISLLRSPRYPDLYADEGHHRFTYSLFPHEGDWTTSGVVNEAFAVNSPLIALTGRGIASDAPFVTVSGGLDLTLGSLKPAEDGNGLMLRLHEPHGARGAAHLTFAHAPSQIETVNLLEEPVDRDGLAANHDGKMLRLEVRPFEVATLRLLF
jgi:alpha-mannosidase